MNNDLISREALTNELLKGTIITDDIYGMGIMAGMDAAIKKVNEAPAVDAVEVVHGRWDWNGKCWECSNCGYFSLDCVKSYCPNCGARMDGAE